MNNNRKNQTFELEKLIDFLESKDSHKAIAIAGKINNKKTKLINSIYQYMSQNEYKETDNYTSFYSSVLEYTKKYNKKSDNNIGNKTTNENIINKGVYNLNFDTIQKTIGDCLRENVKYENFTRFKFFKKLHHWKIKRILKRLNFIEKHYIKTSSSSKLKVIFPILTTITTIGTSIGTPILSIALLRQKEIIEIFSQHGYLVLIAFCALAIICGIVSVIFYLVSSIIASKYEIISKNLVDEYKKIIGKYFVLPSQNKDDVKSYHKKIKIVKNSNYYFDEITFGEQNYWQYLDLLMIHNALGNNATFVVSISEMYELKNLFNNSWGNSLNYYVFNINSYKNGYNKERIINFILSRISKDFGYDFISLFKNDNNFKNYVNIFFEKSENNLQVMSVLNLFKSTHLNKLEKEEITKNKDYFIDIFYLFFLKSLDFYTYQLLIDAIIDELKIPEEIDLKYNIFRIGNFFSRNIFKYRQNALLFNLEKWIDESHQVDVSLRKKQPVKTKTLIKEFLDINHFKKVQDNVYVNNLKEMLKIVKIKSSSLENENFFILLNGIKKAAYAKKITYIIIDFDFEFMLLQNNLNSYHVLALSAHEAMTKKLI